MQLHEAVPPPSIMDRATGNHDAATFRDTGRELAGIFTEIVVEDCPPGPRVLDWGCGPGRVTAHLTRSDWQIEGCDIDAEAVAWCAANIPGAAFQVTGLAPPLPYGAATFEAVIACSVFTHLQAAAQHEWLAEIARILRPGGILAASVHGQPAADAYMPLLPHILRDNGIFDGLIDTSLDGIAPQGYYRVTFQSEDYTRREWDRYLDVIEYREAGLTPTHDLVICRKAA
jgi:SAM-dependent methyltransferase